MIKLCKIVTIVAIVSALGSVVLVSVQVLNGPSEQLDILAKPGVAEIFKKSNAAATRTADTDSILSKEARLFAFGLDPPPPPKSIVKRSPRTKKPPKRPPVAPVITPKVQPTGKFKLIATVCYPDRPEKSLALLNMTSLGLKWHRSGDEVNHQTIHEVKPESIVLYANGKLSEELLIQSPKSTIKSLLKSNVAVSDLPSPTTTIVAPDRTVPTSAGVDKTPVRPKYNAMPNLPTRSMVNPAAPPTQNRPGIPGAPRPGIRPPRLPTTGARTYRRRTVTPPPPPPSPEDRKKSLNNNIFDIQKRMGNIQSNVPEEQKNAEAEAWGKLLKLLEKERTELDSAPDSAPKADSATDDADKSGSSTDNTEK